MIAGSDGPWPGPAKAPPRLTRGSDSGQAFGMPICKGCGEEVDELVSVKVEGKTKKLCEECVDVSTEQEAVAEASEAVVQNMMGFKGRR
jgi:hypothetical protein